MRLAHAYGKRRDIKLMSSMMNDEGKREGDLWMVCIYSVEQDLEIWICSRCIVCIGETLRVCMLNREEGREVWGFKYLRKPKRRLCEWKIVNRNGEFPSLHWSEDKVTCSTHSSISWTLILTVRCAKVKWPLVSYVTLDCSLHSQYQ